MLLSAVILGIFGSLHCVGMCGPIAFLLPLDRKHPAKKITANRALPPWQTTELCQSWIIGWIAGKRLCPFRSSAGVIDRSRRYHARFCAHPKTESRQDAV